VKGAHQATGDGNSKTPDCAGNRPVTLAIYIPAMVGRWAGAGFRAQAEVSPMSLANHTSMSSRVLRVAERCADLTVPVVLS